MRSRRARQRNKSLDGSSQEVDESSRLPEIRVLVRSRIYKRWVVLTSLLTLAFAWLALPFLLDVDKNIFPPNLSDFFLETKLHQYLPDSRFTDEIIGNLTKFWTKPEFGDKNSPGIILRNQGASAHFPVILIPGIISTGLELWEGKSCAKSYFRNRLWGTMTMLKVLLTDRKCWLEHMAIDPETGMDPEGIRIRPAQGLEAADFLVPGYWVWGRVIENLAELGYDHNNLQMAPYDWRLTVEALEKRDHYFTKLKTQIELLRKTNKRKVVVMTHSLGACVWHYFMKWVEADPGRTGGVGGGGGNKWVDTHIESVAHIGGAFLGAPKSLSSIISGESRETAMLGKLETYFVELFFSKVERAPLFRSWSGGMGLLPKGGNTIWGGPAGGIPMVKSTDGHKKVWHADEVMDIVEDHLPPYHAKATRRLYSTGLARSKEEVRENRNTPATWMNPLEVDLPDAPDLKIYCFHGIGRTTELGYVYKSVKDQPGVSMVIDLDLDDKTQNISKGIYRCDGDGTVPLLSLGYMGIKGWRKYAHLNPSGAKCLVREYKDDTSVAKVIDVRGGPKSGDHVDILGNHDLTIDILRIATNHPEEDAEPGMILKERVLSSLKEMSDAINLPIQD